jgi:ABC-type transporter Mla maintaining outer membrane lipid asymmetry ATPase subunit MlaF
VDPIVAEAAPTPAIEMIDVAVSSARRPAEVEVEDVNWRVLPGECWVVAGLHGAGKSDLLAVADGLQRPLRGTVKLFGEDIAAADEEVLMRVRRRVGLVFENGGRMFRNLTVAENIGLPLRYHFDLAAGEADERVNELLELTGLSAFAHNTSGVLNVSWQERVGLARALAIKPEVLLLDRPLSGLDARHRSWWLDFLGKLSAGTPFLEGRPMTLVVTTDDFEPWLNRGQRFVLLKEKRWHNLGARADLEQMDAARHREWWTE